MQKRATDPSCAFTLVQTAIVLDGKHEATVVNVAAVFMHADDPFEPYIARGSASCGVASLASTLHSGGANYSFVDGHVKWLSPNGIGQLQCE